MAMKKSGLGKGLDGMFPSYTTKKQTEKSATKAKDSTKTEKQDQKGVLTLSINEIVPNKAQPRNMFDEDTLLELSESIRQYGVIQPLIVQEKDGYYEIVAGERRWRAAKMAGLKEVPVLVKKISPQESVEISLIENIQREDLNPIEEARTYQRLLQEFNLKQDEVAEKVSKSRTTITNSLRLLKLHPQVQQMLIDQKISAGHARALLTVENPDVQVELAGRIFDERLNVRDIERIVRQLQKNEVPKPEKKPETEAMKLAYMQMEEKMKAVLGTKVTVNRRTEKKGRIEIEYYSREELERIFDLLKSLNG